MSFGVEQANQVKTLLFTYGATDGATIRKSSGEVLDPVAGEYTGGTTTITNLFCAKLPIKKSMLVDERIRMTDIRLICDNSVQPLEQDTIIIDGIDHQVIIINKHKNAETVIAYEVICRA